MSDRKLIAMGTGSQVPGRFRNQNGYFLRWDDEGLLFDPGEGSQRQMIYCGVSASEITKIFITHFHGDHCLGLAGILQRISLDRVSHPVEVYFPASGEHYFNNLFDAAIYYKGGHIVPKPIADEGIVFEDSRMTIEARRLEHPVEVFGYRLQEKDSFTMRPEKLRELGISGLEVGQLKARGRLGTVRIEDVAHVRRGQGYAHIMDTKVCENAAKLARGADMVLMETTYLDDNLECAAEYGHLTASQAATIAHAAGAGKLLMAHYSHRYTDSRLFEVEAGRIHPDVKALEDGDVVEMPRRERQLT